MNPNISALIASYLPENIPAKYPLMVEFAKAYFDFLEKSNTAGFYANALPEQRSIHTQQDQFLQYIQRELGIFVPRIYAADPKVFYDKITELWRSKGSEEAIKTFFLLFLDDPVEVNYPWANVLIPSDGRWMKEEVLRVTMKSGSAYDLIGKQIKQISSEATATVGKVESRTYSDGTIYDLTLIKGSLRREFDPQEDIISQSDPSVRAEIYRSLSGFTILKRGTNYKIGDRITVQGFDGFTFVAFVSAVSLIGEILDIEIANFGSGNTPIHTRISNAQTANVEAQYYLRDFILYQYVGGGLQDGEEGQQIADLISSPTPTVLDVSEAPGLGITSTIIDQDYADANAVFFAEDYAGESNSETSYIAGIVSDEIRNVILNIQSDFGSGAELQLKFGAITGYTGRYEGVHGQLDESVVLQDSYYFQKYSYEVKTTKATSDWINQLTRTVHPAGTKVFGNVFIYNKLDSRVKTGGIVIDRTLPNSAISLEKVGVSDFIMAFVQDYVESGSLYFVSDYVGTTAFTETSITSTSQTIDTVTVATVTNV